MENTIQEVRDTLLAYKQGAFSIDDMIAIVLAWVNEGVIEANEIESNR